MLDHRLTRDGQFLGELCGRDLAPGRQQIEQMASRRIGQRGEDAVDLLGLASFLGHTDGWVARFLNASSTWGQPLLLSS